jgi:hypothetical protein
VIAIDGEEVLELVIGEGELHRALGRVESG